MDVEVSVGTEKLLDTTVVVVFSSLQPNQPGVLQVEVEVVVDVEVLVVVPVVVVVSSKHPHQLSMISIVHIERKDIFRNQGHSRTIEMTFKINSQATLQQLMNR